MSKPPPQTNTIKSYFTKAKAKAKASTTTTTTTSLSNNNSSTSLFESSPDDKKRNHSTTNEQNSTKSTKVSLLSSPSLSPTTTDVGSSDPLTPGGDSNSNISLPSLSNFPLENREELKKMYLAGFRHASAKYRGPATAFGRGLQPELIGILSPQGGIGLPKEEEVDVVRGEEVVQGEYVL